MSAMSEANKTFQPRMNADENGSEKLWSAVASVSATPLWLYLWLPLPYLQDHRDALSLSATPLWLSLWLCISLTFKITETLFPGSADIHVRNERREQEVLAGD